MKHANVGPEERLRVDHNRRVALAFRRGDETVEYLAFDCRGLQRMKLPVAAFESQFRGRLVPEMPLERTALELLDRARRDYLPDFGVFKLLTEIYVMAATQGTGDLASLDMKGLMAAYNALAKAADRPQVKEFKSKAEAIKRVESLRKEAEEPGDDQKRRKAAADAGDPSVSDAGAKAFEALARGGKPPKPAEPPKRGRTAAKMKFEETKKAEKAAKAEKREKQEKQRGKGIGSFCMDLIEKGKTNEEVLEQVLRAFPGARTTPASVAWYRNKLKNAD